MEQLVPVFIILPLVSAFIIPVTGRFSQNFTRGLSSIVFLILTVLCVASIGLWDRGMIIYTVGGWKPVGDIPIGIDLIFDGFSAFILGIINFIALLSSFYSIGYIKKYTSENNFYTLLCLMIAGMNGVVLSGDLFNIYVFLEIASIASYALVAFGVEKEELEASFKYQVLGGLGSLIILIGVGLVYWITGTLNIADSSNLLITKFDNKFYIVTQILFIAGFGLKAAIVPFHTWLPDAHSSAPSPISSLLSGVLIKAVGIYVLIRLFFHMFDLTYEVSLLFTLLGVLSMIVGGILAIGQSDYKRLLAYSSISQVGYIITGVGLGMLIIATGGDGSIAALAIFGGLFHLLNHAIFKSLMFMTAGVVEHSTNLRDLRMLGGLSRKMPLTTNASFAGSMSISGLPPFSGFFSKLIIIIAAFQAQYYVVGAIAALMSIITLAYFLKFHKDTFLSKARSEVRQFLPVPVTMKVPLVILGILCVVLGVFLVPQMKEIFMDPAINVIIDTDQYSEIILNVNR